MQRLSLKGQVIVTLLLIVVSSWLATALTFSGIVLWGRFMSPSYQDLEAQVSQFIAQQGVKILTSSDKRSVEHLLHVVPYQVVNDQGNILYGSVRRTILHNRIQLVQRINTAELQGRSPIVLFDILQSTVTRYFPVFDHDGHLYGALIVLYPSNGISFRPSTQGWMTFLSYVIPFLPFLYFCLFSYLFAKRFGKRMNKPLQVLVQGAQRIEQQDLDFEIESSGVNEIGQVHVAFEKMRAALENSLVRQWQMEQERGHMIASISHDLRTPLTIIQGHVESLLDGAMAQPERSDRYLLTIMHNTNRVIQLIEDMQKVTDVEKPDFSLHPVPVDVRKFVTDWTRDFELLTSREGIDLNVQWDGKTPEAKQMVIDPERVSQILDNIASNSVRFTSPGGTITIRIVVDHDSVTCEISDTGVGFSKTDLKHIFDRFYQGDAARSDSGHRGLGLFIAKTLVQKHWGTITAGNNQSGGAYVRFTIEAYGASNDAV